MFIARFWPMLLTLGWLIAYIVLFIVGLLAHGALDFVYCTFEVVRVNDPLDSDHDKNDYWTELADENILFSTEIGEGVTTSAMGEGVSDTLPLTLTECIDAAVTKIHEEVTCINWGALGGEPLAPIAFGYLRPMSDNIQEGFNLYFSLTPHEVMSSTCLPIQGTAPNIETLTLLEVNDGLPTYVYASYLDIPNHLDQFLSSEGIINGHISIEEYRRLMTPVLTPSEGEMIEITPLTSGDVMKEIALYGRLPRDIKDLDYFQDYK